VRRLRAPALDVAMALVAGVSLCVLPALAAAEAQPDAAAGNVVLQSDVMVAMRDGIQLAADIYLPAQGGKIRSGRFPTLLMRTPYNKEVRATAATVTTPRPGSAGRAGPMAVSAPSAPPTRAARSRRSPSPTRRT